jgi:hypothetical protein
MQLVSCPRIRLRIRDGRFTACGKTQSAWLYHKPQIPRLQENSKLGKPGFISGKKAKSIKKGFRP